MTSGSSLIINFQNYFWKLFSKSPSYHENKVINFKKYKDPIKKRLLPSIEPVSSKNIFTLCYRTIRSTVERRTSHLMVKFHFQKTKLILEDKEVLDYLNDLHENVDVVSINKASKNVAIICKKLYAPKILLKLGIHNDPSTYITFQINIRVTLLLIIF